MVASQANGLLPSKSFNAQLQSCRLARIQNKGAKDSTEHTTPSHWYRITGLASTQDDGAHDTATCGENSHIPTHLLQRGTKDIS